VKLLLDTNVVSELVAVRPDERVIRWIEEQDPTSIYFSVITVGELCKGVEKLSDSSGKDRLRNWLNDELLLRFQNRILDLDVRAMLKWGELVGRLERTGRPPAAIDSLVAAIAIANSCA
jgi:tRNA(fMet)-specific endonuclease VapC